MNPDQYHRILLGLDGVLAVFKDCGTLSPEDTELKFQLTLMRAHALRAESGHPFPSMPPSQQPAIEQATPIEPPSPRMDAELTIPPFKTGLTNSPFAPRPPQKQ